MIGVIENRDLFPTAKVIFDTREDDAERTKWHNNRGNSIGGSEISKIAGYSKYGSPLTVFNEKLGLSEKFKGNIHTVFGTRMEPVIKEWLPEDFKKETEVEIEIFDYPYMMVYREHEYFSANIDGLIKLKDRWVYWENRDTGEIKYIGPEELIGAEIKTGSEFLKKMWAGEEIPDEYYCQVQWYMGITGLKHFLIIYLLGKEVKWKVVPRNDDDIKALFEIGSSFWNNHILAQIPPEPTGLECETKEILYKQAIDNDIESSISDGKLSKYKAVDEQIKALEKEKEQLKQLIYLDLKDSKKGSDGNFKVTRWTVKKDSIDTKLLKEKYPATYQTVLKGQTEYVSMKISAIK